MIVIMIMIIKSRWTSPDPAGFHGDAAGYQARILSFVFGLNITYVSLSLSLSLYIYIYIYIYTYIYIYIYMCMCICIYIYIYIHTTFTIWSNRKTLSPNSFRV